MCFGCYRLWFTASHNYLFDLSANALAKCFMILVQMRLKSWFLILILENNLLQMSLTLHLLTLDLSEGGEDGG